MEQSIVIKKLIAGGKGLGHLVDGMVVMVAGVLPGETVRIEPRNSRQGYLEADLLSILEPSPNRVPPPCPAYGLCGGCDLQHASYSAQLHLKKQILREALERARLDLSGVELADTLPAPAPLAYRHRFRLHLNEQGQPGFRRQGSAQIVPIRHCLLAPNPINRVLAAYWSLEQTNQLANLGQTFQEMELLQCPGSGRVFMSLRPKSELVARLHKKLRSDLQKALQYLHQTLHDLLTPQTELVQIRLAPLASLAATSKTPGLQAEPPLLYQDFTYPYPYRLEWDAACFFQANAPLTPHLVRRALELLTGSAKSSNDDTRTINKTLTSALDLFCGMGTFSVPLGLLSSQISGVEHNRHSLRHAQANSHRAKLDQARFLAGDVSKTIQRLIRQQTRFEALLFDPPRTGLGKATAQLPQLASQRILAISCDPATLARDLKLLIDAGWHLCTVCPIDMFPQTHHVESLALLERN